jgi:hypothetical protein
MAAPDHLGSQFGGGCDWGGCASPATQLRAEQDAGHKLPAPVRQFCAAHAARLDAAESI